MRVCDGGTSRVREQQTATVRLYHDATKHLCGVLSAPDAASRLEAARRIVAEAAAETNDAAEREQPFCDAVVAKAATKLAATYLKVKFSVSGV